MTRPLRIGLLRLSDSAPVMLAHNAGLFAQYGLRTELVVSPSWANIADGLVWKTLDAAIMFAPLAMMTSLGRRGHMPALKPLATLSYGGNTVILRGTNPLMGQWPTEDKGREAFETWRATIGRRPRLSVVHMYSTHFLILKRFLLSIGVNMEQDIEIQVMPPPDIISALMNGSIDGGCVGPPWGTEACLQNLAFLAGGSQTVMPRHIEKQFVVPQGTSQNQDVCKAIINALNDARIFLRNAENRQTVAHDLAAPLEEKGLNLPEAATLKTLSGEGFTEKTHYIHGHTEAGNVAWMLDDMQGLGWITQTEHDFLEEKWNVEGSKNP
ncbi:nitrate ABC transporter ATP-binding protein [Acetobacter pasteurianus]|jgi:ABC-type nitrate/sulfonate/bicarbonate transport system substrate-binding protein|uniref:ABC transporter substrate-binding protein n=1 Tax=Acetobacter pasteurianus TaxID=438 RepID=UPI0002FC7F70|nr:ABC transporter substrate-binding protein [Acetobacter pasteurianus]RCL04266.1 nitrate ABC transporter ATP-binding protein [Acetobacter pasteurianus]GCD51092.1 nitrate/nitrite transporter ATP-binding protein NtrA [Acetobacter pasteurianus subsp. pasteurianus LMG 1262 = NBRC 106471]